LISSELILFWVMVFEAEQLIYVRLVQRKKLASLSLRVCEIRSNSWLKNTYINLVVQFLIFYKRTKVRSPEQKQRH
jgi:hypothetical protein